MRAASRTRRRLAAFGGAIATVGASAALLAPAAQAGIVNCEDVGAPASDPRARCAKIEGIDPGSYLRVRERPDVNSREVGRRYQGQYVEVDCWATGSSVMGDRYWVGIYGGGGPTYVPDYYVDTGDPAVWTREFTRCP